MGRWIRSMVVSPMKTSARANDADRCRRGPRVEIYWQTTKLQTSPQHQQQQLTCAETFPKLYIRCVSSIVVGLWCTLHMLQKCACVCSSCGDKRACVCGPSAFVNRASSSFFFVTTPIFFFSVNANLPTRSPLLLSPAAGLAATDALDFICSN